MSGHAFPLDTEFFKMQLHFPRGNKTPKVWSWKGWQRANEKTDATHCRHHHPSWPAFPPTYPRDWKPHHIP